LPGYNLLPAGFKRVVPFLFARILYSLDGFLKVVLQEDHPLFSQPFCTQVAPSDLLLWKATIHDCKFRCSCMHATGVPGHVALVGEVQKLREEVKELRALLESKSAEIMNHCDEKSDEVSDLVRRNPGMVKEMLKEDFVVEGVAPLTRSDLVQVVNEAIDAKHEHLINKLRNLSIVRDSESSASASSASAAATASTASTIAFEGLESSGAQWHIYDGKFHYLPKGFKLFTGAAKPMWFLWHLGNKSLKVGPYSMINNYINDLKPIIDEKTGKMKDQKKQYYKIQKAMDRLFSIAKEQYQESGGQGELVISLANVELTFDSAYPVLINELYSPKALLHMNPNVIYCTTLGKNIYKHNGALKKKVAANGLVDQEEATIDEDEDL
jgi:hypothetical protein